MEADAQVMDPAALAFVDELAGSTSQEPREMVISVLVVEDDEFQRVNLDTMFESANKTNKAVHFIVTIVDSADAALQHDQTKREFRNFKRLTAAKTKQAMEAMRKEHAETMQSLRDEHRRMLNRAYQKNKEDKDKECKEDNEGELKQTWSIYMSF